MSNIIATCEDNMELMKRYPDNYFELAIVDPPYFNGPQKLGYYGKGRNHLGIKHPEYDKIGEWGVPTIEYWSELNRVSRNIIIWGANYYDFIGVPFKTPRGTDINKFIEDNPKSWIIWDKCNGSSSFNDYELAYTTLEINTTVIKYMWNGMLQGKNIKNGDVMQGDKKKNEKRIHPTQKPVKLYEWQLMNFANEDDKILDTHLGSGSIAIACHNLGFNLTACDVNSKYCEAAKLRYRIHTMQTRLEL